MSSYGVTSLEDSSWRKHWPLLTITAAAIAIGLYARFTGLATAPFGADEFYSAKSVDNVLRSGLPEFPCGGYYVRGLLYQYIVAVLRLLGLQPEFAGRVVAAVASLAVLPAAYLLARRVQGKIVGMLVVTILALSLWEIEMARFARMYAPFQAIFAWYLLYFVKYAVDRDTSALRPMILLSVLGVLTWKGGALLGLANLLPPFINHDRGRLRRGDWIYVGWMTGLLLAFYVATAIDLRGFEGDPGYVQATDGYGYISGNIHTYAPWMTLGRYKGWALLALVPILVFLTSLRWLWSLRDRWLASIGLGVVLLMALLQQIAASIAALILVLLINLVNWRELLDRQARSFVAAVAASGIYWVAFGIFTDAWFGETPITSPLAMDKLVALAEEMLKFPNVLQEIVKPWGNAVPLLSVALFVALGALALRTIVRQEKQVTAMSVLLIFVLTMVLAIGASAPPRHETRYSFFLYPILVILAIAAVALASKAIRNNEPRSTLATILASLLLFAGTEDLQLRHLAQIDSKEIIFRVGMPPNLASHYYSRGDVRALAQWLGEEVRNTDLVISGIPNLSQYYDEIDYFFLDEQDQRYRAYACNGGQTERWNDLPLLYTTNALEPQVATGKRIFMLLYANREERLLRESTAREWPVQVISLPIPGYSKVLVLNPR